MADSLLTIQGYIESEDDGEYESLKDAVAEGRAIIASDNANADEAVRKASQIDILSAQYRKQYLYLLTDSIEYLINEAGLTFTDGSDGWTVGSYPEQYVDHLISLVDEANIRIDNLTALVDVTLMIEELTSALDDFFYARVDRVYSLPIRYTEKDGLPGEREGGNVNNSFIWETPLIYLSEPTDVIRITVTKATRQDNYNGNVLSRRIRTLRCCR